MTNNTTAPKRIWTVYDEGSESRDEAPEIFAALSADELTSISKCYDAPVLPYVPADALEAAQARIAELEGQNQRLVEDRARFPDRPDWVGDMIGAHYGNMEYRIESAERYTRQYEAQLRMEQRKNKELTEALENIVTWGNSDHCTKLRSIARAALEGKG